MIAGLSVLGLIPARGGSKGVPRKNIRQVAGRPLLTWTIDAARNSSYIDRLVLSTDDDEIAATAIAAGCEVPFRRPASLARDETPGIDPVMHALGELPSFDIVVLLQPTSPLRLAADIDGCLERMLAESAPACVSVRHAVDHPYWTYRCDSRGVLLPYFSDPQGLIHRRQDLPPAFVENGAVYAAKVDWLLTHRSFLIDETVGYEMPAERSLDIDLASDLALAERALAERMKQISRTQRQTGSGDDARGE
jgi:CMP-N,N'-diacetyllegionaminic acid synthase